MTSRLGPERGEGKGVATNEEGYYQKPVKCLDCGLHFIVCTDYKEWPDRGSTREYALGEATGLIYCPECGSAGRKLRWSQYCDGFIFQAVPGDAILESLG